MTQAPKKQKPPPPTEAEMAAARPVAKRLLDKSRAFIVLDHPFFATILLKRPFTERMKCPTLSISDTGNIFYNPVFIAQHSATQIMWALCHEILHYASGHGIRRGSRDAKKWNIAADMWINDTLKEAKIGEPIPGCLDAPGSAYKTVEEIYAGLPPDDGEGDGQGQGQGQGQGEGDEGGGDPMQDDMEPEETTDGERSELDGQRKIEVAGAAQVAKMKGKLAGVLQKFAEATIDAKVPWFDVLERYMTERSYTDSTWARPNRRYMPDHYLPSIAGTSSMGEIVIQVDISGSVSPQEIKHYNGHLKSIVELCHPTKVHVIYTDTKVQRHDTFERPEDMEIEFHSGGGTHMPAGFKYIEEQGIKPEVVVTLTDGYTGWDQEPPFPTIHCISSSEKAPYGENIHFTLN